MNGPTGKIDDLLVHAGDLARSAAGQSHPCHKIAECLALDGREDQGAFLGREDTVPHEALGPADVGDGVLGDVLLFDRPIERPLEGTKGSVLAGRVSVSAGSRGDGRRVG